MYWMLRDLFACFSERVRTRLERVFVGEDVPRDILTFIVSFSCHIYSVLMPNHFLCYSSKVDIVRIHHLVAWGEIFLGQHFGAFRGLSFEINFQKMCLVRYDR